MLEVKTEENKNKVDIVCNVLLIVIIFKLPNILISNLIGIFCNTNEQYIQIIQQYQYRISLIGILITFAIMYKITNENFIYQPKDIDAKKVIIYIIQGIVAYFIGTIFISLLVVYFPSYEQINNLFINEENIFRFIVIVIASPFIEEYIFRDKIQNYLNKGFSKKITIFIQALIFGSLHSLFLQQIYAFLFGAYLGIIKEREKNFTSTFIIHMVINFIGWIIGVISNHF